MARVRGWNPAQFDGIFMAISMDRLKEAAEVVAKQAKSNAPGHPSTVTRPPYRTGKYAGKPWTARTAGSLKDSVRVVEKWEKEGFEFLKHRNVRVYAGNYMVYYAAITEFSSYASSTTTPPRPAKANPHKGWLRKSLNQVVGQLKTMFSQRKAA